MSPSLRENRCRLVALGISRGLLPISTELVDQAVSTLAKRYPMSFAATARQLAPIDDVAAGRVGQRMERSISPLGVATRSKDSLLYTAPSSLSADRSSISNS